MPSVRSAALETRRHGRFNTRPVGTMSPPVGSCRARNQFDHRRRHLRPTVEGVRPRGTYNVLAYVVSAVAIVLIIMCFAEVGSRFKTTGGPYLYARVAFGPLIAFQVGWLMWLSRIAGIRRDMQPLHRLPCLLRPCFWGRLMARGCDCRPDLGRRNREYVGVRVTATVTTRSRSGS